MRKELSGPLSRRVEIVRLDYMEPSIFYKVAHRKLIEERKDPINDGFLNLVSLMYEKAYINRDMYNRLPSCSEMLIALKKSDRLIKRANAPQSHLGFAVWLEDGLHLLNASSVHKKVIEEPLTFHEYQKKRPSQTGTRVVRVKSVGKK